LIGVAVGTLFEALIWVAGEVTVVELVLAAEIETPSAVAPVAAAATTPASSFLPCKCGSFVAGGGGVSRRPSRYGATSCASRCAAV
jgi:hypothetical protein